MRKSNIYRLWTDKSFYTENREKKTNSMHGKKKDLWLSCTIKVLIFFYFHFMYEKRAAGKTIKRQYWKLYRRKKEIKWSRSVKYSITFENVCNFIDIKVSLYSFNEHLISNAEQKRLIFLFDCHCHFLFRSIESTSITFFKITNKL